MSNIAAFIFVLVALHLLFMKSNPISNLKNLFSASLTSTILRLLLPLRLPTVPVTTISFVSGSTDSRKRHTMLTSQNREPNSRDSAKGQFETRIVVIWVIIVMYYMQHLTCVVSRAMYCNNRT